MGYAENIIKALLLEEIEQDKVSHAIKKRHEVSFRYDSNDGDARGKKERITVQPVTLGTTKAGNPCFRAYQLNGSSESAEKGENTIPGWRLFLLDRVVPNTWKDTGRVFNEPPMYNPNGDDGMAEVLLSANFSGAEERYSRGGLKKYNQARHAAAVEKNPYYDFQKQLGKKNMAPDFVMKNIKDTQVDKSEREKQWQQAQGELKGNQQSIADMSRQKDFGDEGYEETSGPVRKGNINNSNPQRTNEKPVNYSSASQNGPRYKGQNDNDEEKIDNNDEFEQYPGESTADDTVRGL